MQNLTELERRAAENDPQAMTELGKLALVGRAGARSPNDAAVLLAGAAEQGSAEADAVIAVLIGADAKSPADWQLALGYMERAAWRGWQSARDQLALLCRAPQLAARSRAAGAPPEIWRDLKESIDVATLVRAPARGTIFDKPGIGVIENFATPEECAWMIQRAQPRVARASIFDRQKGGAQYDPSRTNSAVLFNILDADLVLIVLRARIAASTGFSVYCLEETNVLHYATGQQFSRHYDFFDPQQPALAREIAAKGQRAATFLIYMNDAFESGETEFPELGWRYKGRPGDALFFRNVDTAGMPDYATMHAGTPPTAGQKWLLSQWIRSIPSRGGAPA